MTAGYTTLSELGKPGVYEELERKAMRLEEGIAENCREVGIPFTINRVGSMVCLFFTDQQVVNYEGAKTSDLDRFAKYFRNMVEAGVSLPPSQFEGMFLSTEHSDQDIEFTIEANRKALQNL